jgi:hypothetical protein
MLSSSFFSKFGRRRVWGNAPAPQAMERRLTYRMRHYWEAQRRGKAYPSLQAIHGKHIPDMWPWCFVIDVQKSGHYTYFHYLGRELAKYSGIFLSGNRDWTSTLLERVTAMMSQVLDSRTPMVFEEELTRFDGRTLLLRVALLPLSDDQSSINFVLGAANGKLVEELT